MAHELVGTVVDFARPVITKQAFTKYEEGKPTKFTPAEVKLVPTPALVVGVESQGEDEPRLHLAFIHSERLHSIDGSGWRESIDRSLSVRHSSHPEVKANPVIGSYSFPEDAKKAIADMVKGIDILRGQLKDETDRADAAEAKLADVDGDDKKKKANGKDK